VPLKSFIAKEFNPRAINIDTVSREAVTKYLSGLSFPKSDKLSVMRTWLDVQTDLFEQY
jgi:hypothetical protein